MVSGIIQKKYNLKKVKFLCKCGRIHKIETDVNKKIEVPWCCICDVKMEQEREDGSNDKK